MQVLPPRSSDYCCVFHLPGRWDPVANKLPLGRSLHSTFRTNVCATQREGFQALWCCCWIRNLVLHLCRHPLRAPSGHPQWEAHGPPAERVPLRHRRHLQLQRRLPSARGALHPLHHPRRQERRVERAPAGLRRWGWAGGGCRDPQKSSRRCCSMLRKD